MQPRRARQVAQGEIDIVGERSAHADRDALLDHDDVARAHQRVAQRLDRERPERYQRDQADAEAVVAHLVDGVLDGAAHRAHGDDQHFGILGAIGAQQPAAVAAEFFLELGGEFGNEPQRQRLLVMCR